MPNKELPNITAIQTLAKTKMFHIEQVDLKFANGETRCFERLKSSGRRSVIVGAMHDHETIILVREYATGTQRYELGLPKGLIENNESLFDGANRELQEEIGFKAEQIQEITSLTLAPNYMSHSSVLVVAHGLQASKLPGDEPEELELVLHKLKDIDSLIMNGQITEARSIAGLYLIREFLNKSNT